MKKLIAALLVLVTSVSVLVSCGGGEEVDAVGTMYKNSEPTKVVATTTQKFGDKTLTGSYTLTIGYVNGKQAATYVSSQDKMNTIEDGSGEQIIGPIGTETENLWYLEGRGVYDSKTKKWDKDAASFIPQKGAVAINLSSDYVKEYTYTDHTLTFTVPKAKTAEVFGEGLAVDADVSVVIVDDGAVVTNVEISYVLPADAESNVPENSVSIVVEYTYDLETVTFQ